MPSPERGPGGSQPEQEPPHYLRVARFRGEQPAGRAYLAAQEAIFEAQCDLSVYRLLLDRAWHVVILGDPPQKELEQKLQTLLYSGEPASLPAEIVKLLQQRRAEATRLAPWVEGHLRPWREP